jgi:acetyltransferase-like isoleucine patch superfamily enzyme
MNFFRQLLKTIKLKIVLRNKGKNNCINIDGELLKKSKIKIFGNNNKIIIEEGLYRNLVIEMSGDNHELHIKSSHHINHLALFLKNHSNNIFIDKNVSIGGARIVACGVNNIVHIGSDSLLSDNIEIWGCDSHSIMQNGEIINRAKNIVIGKHVWIGTGVKILKGSVIGDGSVVGTGSLLSGKEFPADSVIAGMPARVVKENIKWDIKNLESKNFSG